MHLTPRKRREIRYQNKKALSENDSARFARDKAARLATVPYVKKAADIQGLDAAAVRHRLSRKMALRIARVLG